MSYLATFMVQPLRETLLPEVTCPPDQLFPDPADIFRNDPLADCIRVGVGTTAIDGHGRIIMGAHRESDKCLEGALGPMTETVQWTQQNNMPVAETTLQTMARAASEEWLVDDPNALGFSALRRDGWFLDKVPVGKNYPGQHILAICAVVHLPTPTAERLVEDFPGSVELSRLTLMRPDEITGSAKLRSLAEIILGGVFERGLHIRPAHEQLRQVALPAAQTFADSSDNIPARRLSLVR